MEPAQLDLIEAAPDAVGLAGADGPRAAVGGSPGADGLGRLRGPGQRRRLVESRGEEQLAQSGARRGAATRGPRRG